MDEKGRHLGRERIAALLDGEGPADGAADHLAECDRCRREYELMRRMRMALSAMDESAAPSGEWDRIASRLPVSAEDGRERKDGGEGALVRTDRSRAARARPAGARGPGAGVPGRALAGGSRTALRAAAAVLLFAGGLAVGSGLASDGLTGDGVAAASDPAANAARGSGSPVGSPGATPPGGLAGALAGTEGDARTSGGAAAEAFRRLEQLRALGPSPDEVYRDPASAAEHLARLDALIRASREALRTDPADPALNDFLFEVVEERETYDQALQMASLEYR